MSFKASRVLSDQKRLIDALAKHNIAISYQYPQEFRNGRMNLISWGKWSGDPIQSSNPNRISAYLRHLKNRQYTCVLQDGSLLQLTYGFVNKGLATHRLCYFPCPVIIREGDLQPSDDLVEIVELFLDDLPPRFGEPVVDLNREERLALRTPIRFDYDSRAASADHSAAHCTLNDSGCRIPVFGPLSVGDFVRFTFRHFYPLLWAAHGFLRTWKVEHHTRSITSLAESEVFFERRAGLVDRVTSRFRS